MTNLALSIWLGFSYWIVAAIIILTLASVLILIWLLISSAANGASNKRRILNIIGLVSGMIALCLLAGSFWAIIAGITNETVGPASSENGKEIIEDEIHYLGILPLEKPTTMLERFAGVEQYLRNTTGLNIKLRIYPTTGAHGGFVALVRDFVGDNISFAFLAPVTSVQAHGINPNVHVFACAQKEGSPVYYGHIVVRSDSPYYKVEDLKGKPVCGSSKSSTSGSLMPTSYLMEKNIDKDTYFSPFEFLGSHDKAAQAVLSGIMEAAFINETTFDKYKGLRSIWRHPAVPEFNFNVNTTKVTPEELALVKEALLVMHETDLEGVKMADKKYDKWVVAEPEDYSYVKETIDRVYGEIFYNLEEWSKEE